MTVKEINVFIGNIIDLVNAFNESRRVELGIVKGNIESAYVIGERVSIKIDVLTSTLRMCDVIVTNRYDISGLIYKIDVRYHDTHKEYKANSKFRFMHE